MTRPLVSVVIPNHNYAQFVGAAIESALAQTYSPIEVVVVDNGSTDESLAVLRAYGDRIRVVAQENRGQAGSRNRGIEESSGEFVAFLDADDVWLPHKLEKQMRLFDRSEVGLVYSGLIIGDAALKPLREVMPTFTGRVLKEFALAAGAVVQGGESTAIIRKECFAKVGPFDSGLSISCGWDFYRRVASCYEIAAVFEPLTVYRQHGTNAHSRVDVFEHDVLLRLEKLFSDPLSSEVHGLRRRSYGRSFLMLAGCHLRAGSLCGATRYALKAVAAWPPAAGYLALLPFRRLVRLPDG